MTGQNSRLILASASPWRAAMLENAGIVVAREPARIDERSVEAALANTGVSPEDLAMVLAQAKAGEVAARFPKAHVIGCDQTLSLGDKIFHKAQTIGEAARKLLQLSEKTHQLNTAVCLAFGEETLWSHGEITQITFRKLDPGFVGRHLAALGTKALGSVGGYQVEGLGAQLIERIDGDYFSVIGLPLLPLLAELRHRKLIDA